MTLYKQEAAHHYLVITGVNPEPWSIGQAFAQRRGGKLTAGMSPSLKLQSYQSALREELEDVKDSLPEVDKLGTYEVYFWFWRQIEESVSPSQRKTRSNYADSTNLQKGTEDALQGILYGNDRYNLRVGSEIVAQGPDVEPVIVIRWCTYLPRSTPPRILALALEALRDDDTRKAQAHDNSW